MTDKGGDMVRCKKCDRMTGFSRFLGVSGNSRGIFMRIACEKCLEILNVKTLDSEGRKLVPRVL